MAVREQIIGEMFVANREKLRIFVVFLCTHIEKSVIFRRAWAGVSSCWK